jgi:purine-binding chemotaxis protein CheW
VSLLVDRIGDVIELADEIEPLPDTITGPRRDLVLGTLKLEDRLMLALDVAKATETESRT